MDIVHIGRETKALAWLYSHKLLFSCLKHEVAVAICIRESKSGLWISYLISIYLRSTLCHKPSGISVTLSQSALSKEVQDSDSILKEGLFQLDSRNILLVSLSLGTRWAAASFAFSASSSPWMIFVIS